VASATGTTRRTGNAAGSEASPYQSALAFLNGLRASAEAEESVKVKPVDWESLSGLREDSSEIQNPKAVAITLVGYLSDLTVWKAQDATQQETELRMAQTITDLRDSVKLDNGESDWAGLSWGWRRGVFPYIAEVIRTLSMDATAVKRLDDRLAKNVELFQMVPLAIAKAKAYSDNGLAATEVVTVKPTRKDPEGEKMTVQEWIDRAAANPKVSYRTPDVLAKAMAPAYKAQVVKTGANKGKVHAKFSAGPPKAFGPKVKAGGSTGKGSKAGSSGNANANTARARFTTVQQSIDKVTPQAFIDYLVETISVFSVKTFGGQLNGKTLTAKVKGDAGYSAQELSDMLGTLGSIANKLSGVAIDKIPLSEVESLYKFPPVK